LTILFLFNHFSPSSAFTYLLLLLIICQGLLLLLLLLLLGLLSRGALASDGVKLFFVFRSFRAG